MTVEEAVPIVCEALVAPAGGGPHERRRRQIDEMDGLYREHSRGLIASLRKTFGNGPPDPEDVAHQSFEKFLSRADRGDVENPKAFIWRIARNTFLNAIEREKVRSKYDFEIEHLYFPTRGDCTAVESQLAAREELRTINDTLRAMPERRRHAFILHRVEGLSVAEVARRLGMARSPTRRHINRAAHEIELELRRKNEGEHLEQNR
ncbi:MAG: sigma-70 family RNA polymerase sigma factor [Pseudomonadota bacterium]